MVKNRVNKRLAAGMTAFALAAAGLGIQAPVQAENMNRQVNVKMSREEQRAKLAETNFFSPGKLGMARGAIASGTSSSKKAALVSPGTFGSVSVKAGFTQGKPTTQKVKLLSPGKFGSIKA